MRDEDRENGLSCRVTGQDNAKKVWPASGIENVETNETSHHVCRPPYMPGKQVEASKGKRDAM